MRGIRRSFALCAAGLLAAVGCGTLADSPARQLPLMRAQLPEKVTAPAFTPPSGKSPLPDAAPPADPTDTPLPINLATAMKLANGRPLDVQIAGKQVEAAV